MATKRGKPSDDVSSAPESGTVRGSTSGNNPSNGGNRSREKQPGAKPGHPTDDVSSAPESGTVRSEGGRKTSHKKG